jgi:hypothetical protein
VRPASISGQQTLQRGPHESQREEHGGAVEQRVDLAGLAAGEFDQDVGDEAEAYAVINGENGRASRNRSPTTTLVMPVLPPSATPDPLSM